MCKLALFLVCIFVLIANSSRAQIEVYKGDKPDTATYIAPEDTITRPPMFGANPDEIYFYIENRYNMSMYGKYLSYNPNNVQFSFYVERNGSISDFKIIYSTQPMVAKEIEHIISNMPKWLPGKQDGRKKRTLMVYDIKIQLTDNYPSVMVTKNDFHSEFSNRHKSLKWFMVGGSVIIMITFLFFRN